MINALNLTAILVFAALALFGWLRKAPGPVGADGSTPRRGGAIPPGIQGKRLYMALTVLLILVAVASRAWALTAVPGGVNQDEAMAAVDAYALAHHGTDRFGTWLPAHLEAWGYAQQSVLLSYLSVPFMWMFGLNTLSIRLPMLICSLLGIWVLYRFAHTAFGRKAGLIALAITAVNPWHIMQSRWGLDCNLMAHFMLFGVYGLYLGIQERRWAYIGVACMALGMYSYGIAVYTLPVLLLGIAAYALKKRLYRIREVLLCGALFLAVSWPIIGTMMINAFGWETVKLPFVTLPLFSDSVRAQDLLMFTNGSKLAQLGKNIASLGGIVLQRHDAPWNAIDGYGTLYVFSLALLLIGLVVLIRRCVQNHGRTQFAPTETGGDGRGELCSPASIGYAFLLIWLAVSVLSGLIANNVNVNRVNHIFYPLILLAALGALQLIRIGPKAVTGTAVAAAYGIAFCLFLGSYFGPNAATLAWYNYTGFGPCVERAEASGAERVVVSERNLYGQSRQTTEILTLFYARLDAAYYQGRAAEPSRAEPGKLPYAERYTYVNIDGDPHWDEWYVKYGSPSQYGMPYAAPDTAYVFHKSQRPLFPDTAYTVEEYGDYGVAWIIQS